MKTKFVGKYLEQDFGNARNVTKQGHDFPSSVIYLPVVTSAETCIGQAPASMEDAQAELTGMQLSIVWSPAPSNGVSTCSPCVRFREL